MGIQMNERTSIMHWKNGLEVDAGGEGGTPESPGTHLRPERKDKNEQDFPFLVFLDKRSCLVDLDIRAWRLWLLGCFVFCYLGKLIEVFGHVGISMQCK
ncbi:hypothetical protein AVEN_224387-1 [Araneus ventricosus]|uniref:Uncharacterized protein n=1 Tax=Araneus ventricosus TaxID=182803 RepID=A0A4Y2F7M8_ARAVE|nr:hypothetical protein AVEN_224387-1 [Araneus ventricosus]